MSTIDTNNPIKARWFFRTSDWDPSKDQLIKSLSLIQEEERQRVFQFVFKKDLKPALIGRLLIRKYINSITGGRIKNSQLVMGRTEKGKPIIVEPLNFMDFVSIGTQNCIPKASFGFNVSHQGSYCVLAGDAYSKVGCDMMRIEYREDINRFFNLMTKQFSPTEWKFIKSNSTNGTNESRDQLGRFMRLWCLKESYVKAEGFGITVDLQKISFDCNTRDVSMDTVVTDTVLLVDGHKIEDYAFEESLIDSQHSVAVSVNCQDQKNGNHIVKPFEEVTFDQLVNGLDDLQDSKSIDHNKYWNEFSCKDERPK